MDTYSVLLVVADDDSRVPLGGSFSAVHLSPVTDDDGRCRHQDPLTGLEFGPLADGLLNLPGAHPLALMPGPLPLLLPFLILLFFLLFLFLLLLLLLLLFLLLLLLFFFLLLLLFV